MTNWMTAAGVVLLVGGFATLISLRSELFGGRGDEAAVLHESPVVLDEGPGWPRLVERLPPVEPPAGADPVEAELTQVVLTWPPINDGRRAGRVMFPGRPGDRPTVLEKRRSLYVSRHAADPPS